MKKTMLLLFLFFVAVFCLCAESITATADLGFVQDFIVRTNSYQVSADGRFRFKDNYEVRLPISVSFTEDAQLYDIGLFLDYYPWEKLGLFFGLSLVQFGFVNGETSLEKNFYALNEVSLGWTFTFFKGLVIEPSISVRDPSGTYSNEFQLLKGAFPCNRTFRFRISAGWSFSLNNRGNI